MGFRHMHKRNQVLAQYSFTRYNKIKRKVSVKYSCGFSDLNHLEIISTTSVKYADSFGFTEKEVFDALDEFDLSD